MEIVTGYTGEAHVTAQQDAIRNAIGIVSKGKYIIPNLADGLSAEVLTSTSIRINSGWAINQGRLMGIEVGNYENVSISSGISGSKRADLIVIRYTKDAQTGVESANLVVVEGTAGADYTDPETYDNDLLDDTASVDDLVLYRVKIDGVSIDSVERVADRWYLDTGWRTDLVNIIYPDSGVTLLSALRVIGNKVYLRCSGNAENVNRVSLKVEKEFVPFNVDEGRAYTIQLYPYVATDEVVVVAAYFDGTVDPNANVIIRKLGHPITNDIVVSVRGEWFLNEIITN